jgi:hypothetical protein
VGDRAERKRMQVWTDGPRVGRTREEWQPEFKASLQLSADVERVLAPMLASSELPGAVQREALAAYCTAARAIGHLPELERLS